MFELTGSKMEWMRSKYMAIGASALAATLVLPFALPDAAYKSLIESNISENTGLNASINGNFSLSFFPTIRIEADDIEFRGTIAKDVDVAGAVELAIYDMDLRGFLTGNININEFIIQSPQFFVNGDFEPHIPSWIRNNLAINHKSDVRYQEILFRIMERTTFKYAEITDGSATWNKTDDQKIVLDKFRLSLEKPIEGRDLIVEGGGFINDRSVDLDLRLERPDNFLKGFRSELTFQFDSNPLKITFDGNAAHRRNFVAQGMFNLTIPSILEYCRWSGRENECVQTSRSLDVTSDIRFRDQQLQIEQVKFTKDDFIVDAQGVIDFKPVIPAITGTIETPAQELSDLIDQSSNLDDFDFNLLLVDTYDANLKVIPKAIYLPSDETINPVLDFVVEDRRLSLNINETEIFGGNSNFRFRWNKGLDDGYMDLRFDSRDIDIVRMQRALGQDFQTLGTLKSSFEVQSLGSSLRALMETARIYGEYSIIDGVFVNPSVASSLGGENSTRFEFAEMKGRINGDRGELRSNDIRLIAPNVLINGAGNYDFLNNELKIQLRSENNTEITQNQEGQNPKGFVEISGSLNQLGLVTSMSVENQDQFIPFDGLQSGLLPITDDNQFTDTETQEEFFINESDLLD